jgi:hypothetical protein
VATARSNRLSEKFLQTFGGSGDGKYAVVVKLRYISNEISYWNHGNGGGGGGGK